MIPAACWMRPAICSVPARPVPMSMIFGWSSSGHSVHTPISIILSKIAQNRVGADWSEWRTQISFLDMSNNFHWIFCVPHLRSHQGRHTRIQRRSISMGTLIIRNFRVGDSRSSIKLESELWAVIDHLTAELELPVGKLISALAEYKKKHPKMFGDGTFTSLVRVFIAKTMTARIWGHWRPDPREAQADLNSLIVKTLMS